MESKIFAHFILTGHEKRSHLQGCVVACFFGPHSSILVAGKLSNFDLPAICCPKLESSPLSRREGRKKKRSPCQSSSPSPSCSLLRKEMGGRGGGWLTGALEIRKEPVFPAINLGVCVWHLENLHLNFRALFSFFWFPILGLSGLPV